MSDIECDGGPHCHAVEHIHGCFSERPSRSAVPVKPERYDWAEGPTAQDVIDALRLAVMAQDDPVKVDRLLRTLLEFAPETDSSRGIDLLLRLVAEATVKLEVAGDV